MRGCLDRRHASPNSPLFLAAGETVTINDPSIVQGLAAFFPGLGSGRRGFIGILAARDMQLRFAKLNGGAITVYIKLYRYWGSDIDRGDLCVKGDLESYLRALFANVSIQKAGPIRKK